MTIFELAPSHIDIDSDFEEIRREILEKIWDSGIYHFNQKDKTTAFQFQAEELLFYFGQEEAARQYQLAWLKHFSGKIPLNWAKPQKYQPYEIISDTLNECFQNYIQLPDELIDAAVSHPSLLCSYHAGLCQRLNSEQLLFLLQRGLMNSEIGHVITRQKDFYADNSAVDHIVEMAAQVKVNKQLLALEELANETVNQ